MLDDVKTLCGLPPSRYKKGLIGVEVEMEASNILQSVGDAWLITSDSSLRGESAEYVFKYPLTVPETREAVVDLYRRFDSYECVLHPSIRCGVHIHMNVQDLNVVQLFNLITTYLIFEEVLVSFCGPSREGNLFCLRASDAEYMLAQFKLALELGDLTILNSDSIRYSSINLKSLYKFGSVEFRSLATPTTPDPILNWVDLLCCVKTFSEGFNYPSDIIKHVKSVSSNTLLNQCFSHKLPFLNSVQDVEKKLRRGLKNASLVVCTIDWTSFTKRNNLNPFAKVVDKSPRSIPTPRRLGRKYVGKDYQKNPANVVEGAYTEAAVTASALFRDWGGATQYFDAATAESPQEFSREDRRIRVNVTSRGASTITAPASVASNAVRVNRRERNRE